MARNGQNPFVICKMKSGWLVIGNVQSLPGRDEPDEKRRLPGWVGYDWPTSRKFDPMQDGPFIERMRRHLKGASA